MTSELAESAVEMAVLLQNIEQRSGIDYLWLDPARLERRLGAFLRVEGVGSPGELASRISDDSACLGRLLVALALRVEGLFADPPFWRALREKVAPMLRTWPFIDVWVPSCGLGETALTAAIVLDEEGLRDRVRIYATDPADHALALMRSSRLPGGALSAIADAHREAGGRRRIEEHLLGSSDGNVRVAPALWERIVFAQHNLATDSSPNEFQLILCRDALGDLRPAVRRRAIDVLRDSLCRFGFLALGSGDRLSDDDATFFEPVDRDSRDSHARTLLQKRR